MSFIESAPTRLNFTQLYDIGCIMFGSNFVQASNNISLLHPTYAQSSKLNLHQILSALADITKNLSFDRHSYGSLHTHGTGLATSIA